MFKDTLVGRKLLHIELPQWAPPEQFFAVFPENTDLTKNLLNMKICSIKFVIKKVILNSGVR